MFGNENYGIKKNIFVVLKSNKMTTTTFKTSDYLTTDEILRLTRHFRKEENA